MQSLDDKGGREAQFRGVVITQHLDQPRLNTPGGKKVPNPASSTRVYFEGSPGVLEVGRDSGAPRSPVNRCIGVPTSVYGLVNARWQGEPLDSAKVSSPEDDELP